MGTAAKKIITLAYHGTDIASKNEIISNNYFKTSSTGEDWAGDGIYFFVDSNKDTAKMHAYRWSLRIKKNPPKIISIIEADLEYDKNEALNLNEEDDRELFYSFRGAVINRLDSILKSKGKVLPDYASNSSKLECYVINTMCEHEGYKIVIKPVIISKLENSNSSSLLPSVAYVPNCTIAAVRDSKLISNVKECVYYEKRV